MKIIAEIEQSIEREGFYADRWRHLRNHYFKFGTPQQGKLECIRWCAEKGYVVTGFSALADPNDIIKIRLR